MKGADYMKNFMKYNFNISSIVLCCHVKPGMGNPIHSGRKSHGLAYYPSSGKCTFNFGNKAITVTESSLIYLPKGSSYTVSSEIPSGCYAINFDIDEDISFEPFSFKVKNATGFYDLFKASERVWRARKSGYEMKCKSELYDIIYNLRKEFESGYISKDNSDLIKPAVEHIHNEYTKGSINISNLSAMCGISETYFRRIFGKVYGVSPVKYINNLKIMRAKELLTSGIYTISEIALLSGFNDESYFSREFKKATGASPSEY